MNARVQKLEEWLTELTTARLPGPIARVVAVRRRSGEEAGTWDVLDKTDLVELALRIDKTLVEFGFRHYELRALDAESRSMGSLPYEIESAAEIVPIGPSGQVPALVEDTLGQALRSSRSFAGLGFKALIEGYELSKQILAQLEKENAKLREENAALRRRLTEQWEFADRLFTHELSARVDADKAMRQGRMAEMLTSAVMARLAGRDTTPEGQAIQTRMAMSLLRSIRPDQMQKLLPFLTDDQKLALMELMSQAQEQAKKATPADAASAAAQANANGKGAR